MAEYIPSTAEWVRDQVELYESSGGTQGTTLRDTGLPVIVVTNKGSQTEAIRKTPLMRVKDGNNYVLVASKGGAPKNPVWVYNLRADASVEIQRPTPCASARSRTTASGPGCGKSLSRPSPTTMSTRPARPARFRCSWPNLRKAGPHLPSGRYTEPAACPRVPSLCRASNWTRPPAPGVYTPMMLKMPGNTQADGSASSIPNEAIIARTIPDRMSTGMKAIRTTKKARHMES